MATVAESKALRRLFSPRHIAVFGGASAQEVVRQCKALGFEGQIWPVHPTRTEMDGLPCFASVDALPEAPDASFVAVPRQATVDIVRQLAARGAGGAICYASGFAEVGGDGLALQAELVQAAGSMALIGPNCYGMLNYLDGVALWPDQHGGQRQSQGVALITQSGNIGLNLTMQTRGLPLAYLITVGNKAGNSMESLVESLLSDPRVTVIGMHIEGLDDVAAFSRVALKALRQGVPLVALKAGSSALGAQTAMSHTSSLAGPDALYDALFARCGIARVRDPAGLIETCKFLHVHGPLAGNRIISASCSGGEASLVADLAQPRGLDMPAIPPAADARLRAVLGDKVNVANPLDYHTYIWGDLAAQTACFSGLMDCGFDATLLVLDYPRLDRCRADSWGTTVEAFAAAARYGGHGATVVASLPEDLPEDYAKALMAQGIAPMHGIPDCLDAIAHAARIGAARTRLAHLQPLAEVLPLAPPARAGSTALGGHQAPIPAAPKGEQQDTEPVIARPKAVAIHGFMDCRVASAPRSGGGSTHFEDALLQAFDSCAPSHTLDEAAGKQALAAFGLPVPRGQVVSAAQAADFADSLGYPVVVKAVSSHLAHKTEAGGVQLKVPDAEGVRAAVARMANLSDRFLVEQMAGQVVAEIIVGVQRDAQFGLSLTVGAGGILVELLQDAQTLLFPMARNEVLQALQSLKSWPLLAGFRGKAAGDVDALVDAVLAIAAYAQAHAHTLLELDVNPVLVLPAGQGVLAVDALIRLSGEAHG
jgi:acyl-CoA synthetase (NDP forming)